MSAEENWELQVLAWLRKGNPSQKLVRTAHTLDDFGEPIVTRPSQHPDGFVERLGICVSCLLPLCRHLVLVMAVGNPT